jgi:ADP-ribose pyrophosphatase YjhB (NUDIX family)
MSTACPRLTVAVLLSRAGKLLFVEEQCDGERVFNQPAGHVEPGETLESAATREALEETGWHVRPVAIVGVYRWTAPAGPAFLRVAFAAEALSHDAGRALDADILATHWLAPSELAGRKLRSPLVQASVDDWLAGVRLPLARVRDFT